MPRVHNKGDLSSDMPWRLFHTTWPQSRRAMLLASRVAVSSATFSVIPEPAKSASTVSIATALCVARAAAFPAASAAYTVAIFTAFTAYEATIPAELPGCRTSPHHLHRRLEQPRLCVQDDS